ncbi:hypothetical protein JCM8097_007307 [Rhodosporidiobolus ruineniae]
MALLQLIPALQSRLDALQTRLPLELRQLVAQHLARDDDAEGELALVDADEKDSGGAQGAEKTGGDRKRQEERTIPHEVLVKVSRWAKEEDIEDRDDYRLASLLRLTGVHAPPLLPREKSPELLAILADIQLQQDRASYASLTSLSSASSSFLPMNDPFDPTHFGGPPKTVAEEWKDIRREVSAIVNIGVSMFGVATGFWWVSGAYSYAIRLGLALGGALAIAAIEGFLYYRFFTRLEESRRKAGSKGKTRRVGIAAGRALPVAAPSVSEDKVGRGKKGRREAE